MFDRLVLELHRVFNTSNACSHDCASAVAIVTVQSVAGNEGVEGFLVYLQDCGELGFGHALGGADFTDPA